MKGLLISGHRRGSFIDLYIRGEDGRKHKITVTDFKPYFYIHTDYGEYMGIFGESLSRVEMRNPSDVRNERNNYNRTWEADIPYVRRFLIDQGIYKGLEFPERKKVSKNELRSCEVNIDPVIVHIDIELLPNEKGFPNIDSAIVPVVSFTVKSNKNPIYFTFIYRDDEEKRGVRKSKDHVVVYLPTEKDLLLSFCDVINKLDPDIITGWNIIAFDYPYLQNRFKNLGLRWVDDWRFEVFDLYLGYQHLYQQPTYQLKQVVLFEDIEQEYRGSFRNVEHSYFDDLDLFVQYNKNDVYDTVEIDKKHSIIEFFLQLRYISGLETIGDIYYSRLIDTTLLRIAHEKGICLPTNTNTRRVGKYSGAFVYAEDKGLYDDVAVFDFNRYYPSIVKSFCISPENIDSKGTINIISESGNTIKLKQNEGIIQTLINRWYEQRNKIEKKLKTLTPGTPEYESLSRQRQAVKDLTNAIYGYLGYPKSRLYRYDLATTVTEIGREGIHFVIRTAEQDGFRVLLSDTDSISIQMSFNKAESYTEYLNKKIQEYFQKKYGIDVDISIKFEKYIKKFLLTGVKKRYSMRIVWENGKVCDYISTRGFENIRTDQSIFTRDLLSHLFELVLYEKSNEEVLEFINKKIAEFPKRLLVEVAISKGINKPLNTYKANTPHVRGAIYANKRLGTDFKQGDKVKMLWIKGIPDYPATNVICFNEDTELPELVVDWKKMKDVCIIQKIEPILDAIGLNINSSKTTQTKL